MSTQMVGIEISKPDKELFPESDRGAAVTKLDLALYYESVAQVMLPHLRGRPVNMERFPDGIEKSSFYEKRVPAHSPTSCTPPRSPRPRADSDRSSWTTSAAWSTSPSRPASRRTPGSAGQTLSSTPICSWSTSTRRCPVSRGYHAVVPLRRTESFDDVRAPSPVMQPGCSSTASPTCTRSAASVAGWPEEATAGPTARRDSHSEGRGRSCGGWRAEIRRFMRRAAVRDPRTPSWR